MLHMSDEAWKALSKEERKAITDREIDAIIHQVEFVQLGLAVRRAGLIYFLPLCHDAYGENV